MRNFITDPATKFDFQPHDFVPFKTVFVNLLYTIFL